MRHRSAQRCRRPQRGAEDLKRRAFVSPVAPSTVLSGEAEFWARLGALGRVEGKNITFATYYADGDADRLPKVMAEAVAARPDVLVSPGTLGARGAKRATAATPIVGWMGDPLGTGLIARLSRPGGNLTGMSVQNAEEGPLKWLELLRELPPSLSRIALPYDRWGRKEVGALESPTAASAVWVARGLLHRAYPQGRQAGRSPDGAALRLPDGGQCEDGENAADRGP